jgi:DegV family protein with EDD domain
MRLAIVTDSTSDLEPERARQLGVTVVPLVVNCGSRSYRYHVDLSRAEFYEKLVSERELPTTAQPSVAMFEEAFSADTALEILCITISSHLSGTINAARLAARGQQGRRVAVVDSLTASGGLGLLVLHAAELRARGASLDEILAALDDDRAVQRLFACLPDLSHVERTGRIGRAQAALGTLMRIVPVLSFEGGEIVAMAQVRTFARAQEAMIDAALEGLPDAANARFIIVHTNAPEIAAANRERLMQRLGGVEPRLLEVWEAGPVIATHGGPGAVGICVG